MSDRNDELAATLTRDASDRLVGEVQTRGAGMLTTEDRRALGTSILHHLLSDHARARLEAGQPVLTPVEEEQLTRQVLNNLFFSGAVQQYLDDPTVMEVNALGCRTTWIVRTDGTKEPAPPLASSNGGLIDLTRRLAAEADSAGGEHRYDAAHPHLDLQLPNGDRLFALMAVTPEPILCIRRHNFIDLVTLEQLRDAGMVDDALVGFLAAAVAAQFNIIIAGGRGAGKTTLLRSMCNAVDPGERMVVIEDSPELGLDRFPQRHPDLTCAYAREANIEGEGGVSISDLTRWVLRSNADRVCVGEVRGAEVVPMLSAMAVGTQGSMCTVHANSSRAVFSKLATYAAQPPERLSQEAANQLIASAVDFVVYLERDTRRAAKVRRYVSSVRAVVGEDGPMVVSDEVFAPGPDGRAVPGAPLGVETLTRLEERGFDAGLLDRPEGVVDVTALAGLCGALFGAGIWLIVAGLRSGERRSRPPVSVDGRMVLRAGGAVAAFVVVAAATRWPVAAVAAAALAAVVPGLWVSSGQRVAAIARTEAIATWAEMLRDTVAAGAGLIDAIRATAAVPPAPLADPLRNLAAAMGGGNLPAALRDFGDEVADPMADLVVAALVLASTEQARGVGDLLGTLARATRDQAEMRQRVHTSRARSRTNAHWIAVIALGAAVGFLAFDRPFLRPYDTAEGQVVLALIGACYVAAFWLLERMSRTPAPPRLRYSNYGEAGR